MVLVTERYPKVLEAVPPKVLAPVKMLALERYAKVEEPVRLLMDRPVIVAPVKLALEVTVKFLATKLVVVTFVNMELVPVAFVQVRLLKVSGLVTFKVVMLAVPMFAVVLFRVVMVAELAVVVVKVLVPLKEFEPLKMLLAFK